MDGATSWETFRYITLPAIKNTLIVVGVLQVIIGLQVFDLLYSLTSGGPGRDTYVLIKAIYDITFGQISLGYGAAITVVLFLIIVAASFLILIARVRRRRAGRRRRRRSRGGRRHRTHVAAARLGIGDGDPGERARVDRRKVGGSLIRLPRTVTKVGFAVGVLDPLLLLCRPDRVDDHRQPAAEPGARLAAAEPDPQPVARRLPDDRQRSTLARIAGGQPAGRTADRVLRHRPQRAARLRPRPLRHQRQGDDPGAAHPRPDGARPSSWPSRSCASSRSSA